MIGSHPHKLQQEATVNGGGYYHFRTPLYRMRILLISVVNSAGVSIIISEFTCVPRFLYAYLLIVEGTCGVITSRIQHFIRTARHRC